MTVKRPAVGAEGFVLDHYDQEAIETHLQVVGERLMEAFGEHPPNAIFSDSLEDYGSDWTGNLLQQFVCKYGRWFLLAYLSFSFAIVVRSSARVRDPGFALSLQQPVPQLKRRFTVDLVVVADLAKHPGAFPFITISVI